MAGVEIVINGWKASRVYDTLKMCGYHSENVLYLLLIHSRIFRPLPINNDDDNAHGISDAFNVSPEVKEGFVDLMVDGEDEGNEESLTKRKGTAMIVIMLST